MRSNNFPKYELPSDEFYFRQGVRGYFVVLTDKKTGVEYLVFNNGDGMCVCPRYNLDGSLFKHQEEQPDVRRYHESLEND